MSQLKRRMMKLESAIGKDRKLTDADYKNCREYVWAGTVPDHREFARFVKTMRKHGLIFLRNQPIDRENRRVVLDNGIIWENLTDEEIDFLESQRGKM